MFLRNPRHKQDALIQVSKKTYNDVIKRCSIRQICAEKSCNDANRWRSTGAGRFLVRGQTLIIRGDCEDVDDISESVHWWWGWERDKLLSGAAMALGSPKNWKRQVDASVIYISSLNAIFRHERKDNSHSIVLLTLKPNQLLKSNHPGSIDKELWKTIRTQRSVDMRM